MHRKFKNERRGREIAPHRRIWRYTFARDMWKEIMKNNLMSCYKYSHWDPFMDVNPKYHRQGVRLSLSASLLFEDTTFYRRFLVPSFHQWCDFECFILDVIEHCKYLTKTIFIVRAASTCQLIVNWPTFRALWLQYAPELSKEFDCEGKWDGGISPTKTHSNVCFFRCRRSGSQMHSNGVGSNDNSRVDGLGKCSSLSRIAVHHSHHSRR